MIPAEERKLPGALQVHRRVEAACTTVSASGNVYCTQEINFGTKTGTRGAFKSTNLPAPFCRARSLLCVLIKVHNTT